MLLAAIMVLSLAVTAFAADLDLSGGNSFNNDMMMESVQNASAGGDLGVFSLELTDGKDVLYFSAFLLEKDGYVYLVTGGGFGEALSQFSLTLISSGGGGYAQKASVLGEDYYFTYLSASGLDQFIPLSMATSDATDVTMYLENAGQGLGSADLDLNDVPKYTLNGTNDVAYIDGTSEADYMFVGVPFVEQGTLDTVAIGLVGANPDGGDSCLWVHTIRYAEPDTGYCVGTMNGGDSGNNGGGNSGNNGGGNSGNNGGGNSGNSGDSDGGFEFKPIYLLGIAAVAVIIFLIVRANSKGGRNGSNVGTVALEQTSAAPIDGGATLPLDPNQGTLPLDPNANIMPVATAWQLRAVDGSFNGQTFPISGTLRLGRAPQCQVVFPAGTPGISSNHCEVALEGGSVVLRDLGSSYGTFCKGNKLAPHSNCYLNPGDSFTMAQGQTFQLEAAGAVAQSTSIAVRDAQGRDYRTGSGRMTFGRGDGNKVQFPADDKGVSSNHCVLYHENGKLYLMDVGSTNGTFLNDKERLQPNVPYRIRKGTAFYLTNRKNTFVVTED